MVYYCKYCGAKTECLEMCKTCRDKVILWRQIKAMLMPYYESKKARERAMKNGDQGQR